MYNLVYWNRSESPTLTCILPVFQPSSPSQLVDDVNEIIEEETGVVPFGSYSKKRRRDRDSGYGSLSKPEGDDKEVRSQKRVIVLRSLSLRLSLL